MATPSDKLAQSLEILKSLQDQEIVAIRTSLLTRTHRERLLRNGFIKGVIKGWYISSRPDEPPGESTAWYTSFWGFCADYLNNRFNGEWCLSPEQSLSIHIGNLCVPNQLLVRSQKGGNKPTPLLFETSIFDLRLELPVKQDIITKNGLNIMSLPSALVNCSPRYFSTHPIEMRAALAMISSASDILHRLLKGGHSKVAGRLAGAFRNIGRDKIAENIIAAMRSADYTIHEDDPFEDQPSIVFTPRDTSPYVNRMRMNWAIMRGSVIERFPSPPNISTDTQTYLKQVDDIYATDAYHSLSIEGYNVSFELIERVRSGEWNPDLVENDRNHKNALAARGYWQAFLAVKQSLEKILNTDSEEVSSIVETDHEKWYRELFAPSVTAGILETVDLAGYRNHPIYIRGSMHVPPNYIAVRELIPAFFDLLRNEDEPAVRTVLGHFFFVYIHPYMDGNGRMGRFLMNVMMASGGYPWTVIPVEQRAAYMAALEEVSVSQNIIPFTEFLAGLVNARIVE
ncbi:MAG: cell filamentation protein Fic [Gammaproteobacteria bacterium]|nr:MAG: cell filamentation protein Fic [Gammaproteobacteria bacterium]